MRGLDLFVKSRRGQWSYELRAGDVHPLVCSHRLAGRVVPGHVRVRAEEPSQCRSPEDAAVSVLAHNRPPAAAEGADAVLDVRDVRNAVLSKSGDNNDAGRIEFHDDSPVKAR